MGWGGEGGGTWFQVGIPSLRPRNPFLPRNDELESERAGETAGVGKTEASWGINHDIKNKYCRTEVNVVINNFAVIWLFFIVLFR